MTETFFVNTSAYDIDEIYIKGMEQNPLKVDGGSLSFDEFAKTITFETIVSGVKGKFTFDYDSVAGVKYKNREEKNA